ncbi:hypothetical protein [Spartinivicinus poritis]|uniref:Uncharacterized protein n=1 Tax=Spartinivicinus poritis TaxID=2994640 RepID=A0ABT5U745_9GAMM|nr:hypothetical protein [Spartinivicinus sp. A2-2]MDE1462189.1 hypothetical protein [Spartinivicinus sp. A2-2]
MSNIWVSFIIVYDTQALIANKVDEISESIYELEKPTEFTR